MYDEPDDDYMTSDQAIQNGWIDPDTAGEIRALVKLIVLVELTDPNSKSAAAFLLLRHCLDEPVPVEGEGRAAYEWARKKLGRDLLV